MNAITQPQKARIRSLLRKAELDAPRVGLSIARRLPHVDSTHMDRPVDVWIDSLSVADASDVIGELLNITE